MRWIIAAMQEGYSPSSWDSQSHFRQQHPLDTASVKTGIISEAVSNTNIGARALDHASLY